MTDRNDPGLVIHGGGSGGDFKPVSAGRRIGVCAEVYRENRVTIPYGAAENCPPEQRGDRLTFVFQVADIGEDQRRKEITQMINLSRVDPLHKRTNLRKFLEQWRGRPLTDEQCQAFDVSRLRGVCGWLTTSVGQSRQGREFAKLEHVGPLQRGEQKLAVSADYVPRLQRQRQDAQQQQAPPPAQPAPEMAPEEEVPF